MKKFASKIKFLLIWLHIICCIETASAQSGAVSFSNHSIELFNDEHLQILNVRLDNGTNLVDALEVYRQGDFWYIPLVHLSDQMGFNIQLSTTLGLVEGFYYSENRKFRLDLNTNQVDYSGRNEVADEGSAYIFEDEVFIRSDLFEKWFLLSLKIDSFSSQMLIKTKMELPIEARKRRDQNSTLVNFNKSASSKEVIPFVEEDKNRPLDIFFDGQLTGSYKQESKQRIRDGSYAASVSSRWSQLGIIGQTSGSMRDHSSRSYLNFNIKDPNGNLFGVESLKSVELNDQTSFRVPLIVESQNFKGLSFSSEDLAKTNLYGRKTFRGALPAGWEVELYQNDVQIGRFVADDTGEYLFESVPLYYGSNRFRLVFYGPQGQLSEEVQTVQVGSQFTRPNQIDWRGQFGWDDDRNSRLILGFDRGVGESATAGFTFVDGRYRYETRSTQYGLLNLAKGISSSLWNINYAFNSKKGSAVEVSSNASLGKVNISAANSRFWNYESLKKKSTIGLLDVRSVGLYTSLNPFLPISLNFNFDSSTNRSHQVEEKYSQKMGWQWGRFYFFNSLNKVINRDLSTEDGTQSVGPIDGTLSVLGRVRESMARFNLDYSNKIDIASFDVQSSWKNEVDSIFKVRHLMASNSTEGSVNLVKDVDDFKVNMELLLGTKEKFYIGSGVSFSGVRDRTSKSFEFNSDDQADYGAVEVFCFSDANQNGVWDEGEVKLPGVGFLVNGNNIEGATEDDGHTYLMSLPVWTKLKIAVDNRTLAEPFYMRSLSPLSVILKPGRIQQLQFPIVNLMDLDGMVFVESRKGRRGLRNIQVELLNGEKEVLKTVRSESDGYYYFGSVPFGAYTLRVKTKNRDAELVVQEQEIVLDSSGVKSGNPDFILGL